jgi:recombination protein RecT
MSELATRTPMQEVVETIEHPSFMEQVKKSLPDGVSMDRFVQVTLTAVRSNPELITRDQNTLFASIVRCAQDGLLPDGREAAFVSFGNKVAYMPMIGGFRKIAAENGWAIDTHVVYANDDFVSELGEHPRLHHKPAPLDKDPGALIGAYAVATHEDGRKIVEVMRKTDILKVRAVSRAKDSGPWKDWEERMWEKTVGRRIFGKIPLSGRLLERAQSVMEAHDGEYALHAAQKMTVDEANVAAPLSNLSPPDDGGPDDSIQDAEYEDTIDDADLEAAARVLVPKGVYNERGLDIGQVAGLGVEGSTWILSTLKKPRTDASLNGFRDSLELFVKGRLPEVWSVYEAWRAEQ